MKDGTSGKGKAFSPSDESALPMKDNQTESPSSNPRERSKIADADFQQ